MMSYFGSSWWVVLMGTGMVLFWGLVIWAAFLLVGGVMMHRDKDLERSSPLQILDQRLARAEIADEEYSRLRLLVDDRSPSASRGGR